MARLSSESGDSRAPGSMAAGSDWDRFRGIIGALKAEPPCVRPGTGDHSWLRQTNPEPVAAAAWDAAWDEFERSQKVLEDRKLAAKDTSS